MVGWIFLGTVDNRYELQGVWEPVYYIIQRKGGFLIHIPDDIEEKTKLTENLFTFGILLMQYEVSLDMDEITLWVYHYYTTVY